MRIAYITDGLYPYQTGGMGKYAAFLLDTLRRLGTEVEVWAPTPTTPATLSDVHWMPWQKLPRWPGHYIRENRIYSSCVNETLSAGTFDVILAHGLTGLEISNARTPLVVHPHGLESFQERDGFVPLLRFLPLRFAFTQLLRRADGVASFGSYFDTILLNDVGVSREAILRASNAASPYFLAADPSEGRNRDGEKLRFLFVGRAEMRKGLDLYLQAAKHHPSAEFWVVGPHSEFSRVSAESNLRFFGEVRDERELCSIYSQVDVVVLPSSSEGFPTVVLEALAREKLVIASDVGAVPELAGRTTIFLFERKNLKSLLSRISEVTRLSSGERKRIGEEGRQLVKTSFTWDHVTRQLLEGLEGVMQRNYRRSKVVA